MQSADGDRWTEASDSATAEALRGVASNGTRFVAVGDKSTILYGDGDAAWTRVDTGGEPRPNLLDVAWGGSRFVAVGERGAVEYSADGKHWTKASDTATEAWLNAVTWGGGRFVAGRVGRHDHPQRRRRHLEGGQCYRHGSMA